MMTIHPIKTDTDYPAPLRRIEALMDAKPDTAEFNRCVKRTLRGLV